VNHEEAADVLERAAEILKKDGHCQYIRELRDGRRCALGALGKAINGDPWLDHTRADITVLSAAVLTHLRSPVTTPHPWAGKEAEDLVKWNNESARTEEEVIDAFLGAAQDLRREAELALTS
jgi:hypothetical protein